MLNVDVDAWAGVGEGPRQDGEQLSWDPANLELEGARATPVLSLEPFDCCCACAQGKQKVTQKITTNLCPPQEAVNFSVSLGFGLK